MKATITRVNGMIAIKTPYNAELVSAIKNIAGRKWDATSKCWLVPIDAEDEARGIVREFFAIEGDSPENAVETELVTLKISGGNTAKRSYPGGVTVDGIDLVNMSWGGLTNQIEIVKSEGGFTYGDSRHAFSFAYTLTIRIRKGAVIASYGNANHRGDFEILSRERAAV